MKKGDVMLYQGYRVEVVEVRKIAGGVAVDVRQVGVSWPWTVESFTTSAENLRKVPS